MTFPKHLFRCPGPYRSDGIDYAVAGAPDAAREAVLLANGWFGTLAEAAASGAGTRIPRVIAHHKRKPRKSVKLVKYANTPTAEAQPAIDETSPPTRAELEAMASELGIAFDGRHSDKRLAARIDEALRV